MAATLFQLGYLVDDLDTAMAHWTATLGAGPFFVLPPRTFLELTVDGAPSDDPRTIDAVAVGHLDDMQIELIVPGPARSTYRHFLDGGQRGLHHLGMMSEDYDGDLATAFAHGYASETEARTALTRIAYLRPPAPMASSVIELVEANALTAETFGMIRAAATGWDGRDPVRAL